MKHLGFGIAVFLLALVGGSMGASNKLNWLTQVLSPGASASGQVAGVSAAGNTAFFKLGTNLSVDGSGNLNAASANVNFANAINVTAIGSTITLPNTPKSTVSIAMNGQILDSTQFTVSGVTVTLAVAPLATDNFQATYLF